VDAYPERPFQGVVEKIEPQAVVQQSVTMFPVIMSLDNNEGLLKPGMNGEVSMIVERREKVVAVSNDAVKTLREASTAALLVGLNPDSVMAMVRSQQSAMRSGAGTGAPTDAPAARPVSVGDAGTARDRPPGAAGARPNVAGSPPTQIRARAGRGLHEHEGEKVAMLSVASLQQRREQQNDRFRSMTGGGVPGMQRTPSGSGAGGGAGSGGRPGGR